MKNLYKRADVFYCRHEAHRGFSRKLSVYHILKKKNCFPEGCFYFRWHCKQLSKRNKCFRGFSKVGRKCFNCRYFYEEKIHNTPELQCSETQYRKFLRELDEFEEILQELQNKDIEFEGRVSSVKPRFVRKIYPKKSFLSFRGYLIVFKEVYLDRYDLDDVAFGLISSYKHKQIKPGIGDKIEAKVRLSIDQGRILLGKFRSIETLEKGEKAVWTDEKALVSRETAVEFDDQPDTCVQCPYGALIDVEYLKDSRSHPKRRLLCLKGQSDFRDCYVRVACGMEMEANEMLSEF